MNLPDGLINLINSEGEAFEMYFKNSEQIVQIFHDLEQENLFLMKENQEIEINNEEIHHEYKKQVEGHERQIEALLIGFCLKKGSNFWGLRPFGPRPKAIP